MCNEAIKSVALSAILVSGVALTSCSDRKEEAEKRATQLYSQAEKALEARNYQLTLGLLDSIDSSCRAATDTRRRVMHLRAAAEEGLTIKEIETTDSLMAIADFEASRLTAALRYVSNPIEGYYVATGSPVDVHGTTGIFPRLMKDGTFYMISTVSGRSCNHSSVTVSGGGESATTAVIRHDGEQNDRSSGTEIVNYSGKDCDTIPKLIMKHPEATFSITFNGSRPYTITMSESQKKAFTNLYGVIDRRQEHRKLSARKNVLEKRLQVLRSQAARTFVEQPADPDSTPSSH